MTSACGSCAKLDPLGQYHDNYHVSIMIMDTTLSWNTNNGQIIMIVRCGSEALHKESLSFGKDSSHFTKKAGVHSVNPWSTNYKTVEEHSVLK